jgi:hypothetical protein
VDPDDDAVLDRPPSSARSSPVAVAVRLLVVTVVLLVGFSVGAALAAPGDASVTSRLANWARDHYLGFVVG